MSTPKYEIKGLKTGPSREWGPNGAYTCTLYRDGKRVAKVSEYGGGGPKEIKWLDKQKPRVQISVINYKEETHRYNGTPEEKILAEYACATPYDCYGEILRHSCDSIIGEAVIEFEKAQAEKKMIRQYKRWCKNQTCFRLKGDKEGLWRTMAAPFSDPRVKPVLTEMHGDNLEEILNERFA